MGPGLYDWTDDGEFTTWLANHPTFDHEASINCITEFFIDKSNEASIDLATLVDDITYEDVCHLEIDGTQIEDLETLMKEEDILPDPLHFRRTSFGIEVGYNLPIHPPIPNDWYHGPTNLIRVQAVDWKKVDVSYPGEEPRIIKVGSQLSTEETTQYKNLVMEYRDIFAWSYKNLKGIPPEVAQHTIPLFQVLDQFVKRNVI
jgi:hypothetical protein